MYTISVSIGCLLYLGIPSTPQNRRDYIVTYGLNIRKLQAFISWNLINPASSISPDSPDLQIPVRSRPVRQLLVIYLCHLPEVPKLTS